MRFIMKITHLVFALPLFLLPTQSFAGEPENSNIPASIPQMSQDDYPPAAIRNEESGVSVATFTVGVDGKVSQCLAIGATPTLDAETCRIITRRFHHKPATDKNGLAVEQKITRSFAWSLGN